MSSTGEEGLNTNVQLHAQNSIEGSGTATLTVQIELNDLKGGSLQDFVTAIAGSRLTIIFAVSPKYQLRHL